MSVVAWELFREGYKFYDQIKKGCLLFQGYNELPRKQQLLFWVAADPGLMIWRVAPDLQTLKSYCFSLDKV